MGNEIKRVRSTLCAGIPGEWAWDAADTDEGLRRRIVHFLWVARHYQEFPAYRLAPLHVVPEGLVRPTLRPDESAYSFLAYLLSGDMNFAKDGKERLLELAHSVAEKEKGTWVQMHTWCDAFPFARWILFSDWIWDAPVFTVEEKAFIEERFLYYLWAHPYQRLLARPIEGTPCNNQNAAMALACVVGGYLFGMKHGKNPRALQILEYAFPHLVKFVTAFPRGGYSFEGSNYMAGVNAFLLPFAIDCVEAVSGSDVLDVRENAHCASPREVLQAIMRLTTPDGLTLPWDCAGFARAEFTHAAAYLAFRTGDHGPLNFFDSIGEMERPAHTGWGFDKTPWTLLWTLRAQKKTRTSPVDAPWTLNHAEPDIGAGASGPKNRLFYFQMWDRSHWPPGRAQFNPNAVVMTFDGSPLLLDGECVELAKEKKFDRPEYQFFRADIQAQGNVGQGTVGAHNTLIFDDKEHFAAHHPTEGKLCFSHYATDIALFESEVASCYREQVDAASLRRGSLILGDDLVLIRDHIETATPHKITWRVHTRMGPTHSAPGYFRVTTPEHVHLEICTPHQEEITHVPYSHTKKTSTSSAPSEKSEDAEDLYVSPVVSVNKLEAQCHEVEYSLHGRSCTLFTLLVPSAGLREWKRLDASWQWAVANTEEEIASLQTSRTLAQNIDFSQASWFYTTDHHAPGIGLYRQEFHIDEMIPSEVRLELPRMVRSARIKVNEHTFTLSLGYEQLSLLPHHIQIAEALKQGSNQIEIIVPSTLECALQGTIRLLVAEETLPSSRLVQVDPSTLEIHHHGVKETVRWSDDECLIHRANGETVRIPIVQQNTHPDESQEANTSLSLEKNIPEKLKAPVTPSFAFDPEKTLAALEGDDWRVALESLEKIPADADLKIIEAVRKLLEREHHFHPTLPQREDDDVCWYRLKAASARVLGRARYEPATDLLGTLLLGPDFYPARMACAWALGEIASPRAWEFLSQIPDSDEWNTFIEAKRALEKRP